MQRLRRSPQHVVWETRVIVLYCNLCIFHLKTEAHVMCTEVLVLCVISFFGKSRKGRLLLVTKYPIANKGPKSNRTCARTKWSLRRPDRGINAPPPKAQ